MNLWLLAVLAAAAHAAAPFHWEFDLKRCDRIGGGYDCFAPVNGKLTKISTLPFDRTDYQMHPHVIAINAQAFVEPNRERWQIIMQSRSRKHKVDVDFGMILARIPVHVNNEIWLKCRVVNGKVQVSTSPNLIANLIDSYFDDHHLYCDFTVEVRRKSGISRKMSEIVSEKDQFALSVSTDGVVQSFFDGDVESNERSSWKREYIAGRLIYIFEKHECNLAQVKSNLTNAPAGGKARQIEFFSRSLGCPDDRYIIHVSDGKGRKIVNANIECSRDGQYEISDRDFMRGMAGWKVEKGETFNAFCHVEDKYLCPMSIPCEGSNCPYVTFQNIVKEFEIRCQDMSDNILVVGAREFPFTMSVADVHCNPQHDFIVERHGELYDRQYQSPPTAATEAYCANKDTFYPNCVRRDPLCNGKTCSIVKGKWLYQYDITCINPNHVFQDYSKRHKKWITHKNTLNCKENGNWGNWQQTYSTFARCKDPADTAAPVEE